MAEYPGRYDGESELSSRLSSLSTSQRQQAREIMGSPPDPRRLGEAFWIQVQREIEEELAAVLILMFAGSALIYKPFSEGSTFQTDALTRAATDYAYRRSINASAQIVATSRDRVAALIDQYDEYQAATGTHPPESLIQGDLVSIFGPDRAAGIAITEVTAAQSAGSEWVTRINHLQSEHDIWFTEMDGRVCDICGPLHASNRSEWQMSQPSGPPAHPRCRCWIQYAFERSEATAETG